MIFYILYILDLFVIIPFTNFKFFGIITAMLLSPFVLLNGFSLFTFLFLINLLLLLLSLFLKRDSIIFCLMFYNFIVVFLLFIIHL